MSVGKIAGCASLVIFGICVGMVLDHYLVLPTILPESKTQAVSPVPSRQEVVTRMTATEDAARAALHAADRRQKEQQALLEDEAARQQRDEEAHREAVATAMDMLARARGLKVGDDSEPAWIESVRRGAKSAYEQTCDAYMRYRSAGLVDYALTSQSAHGKVTPKDIGLSSFEDFQALHKGVAKEAVGGLLFALKNRPVKEIVCGSGEGAVQLQDGPEVFETILYILKSVGLTPEATELATHDELRDLLRNAVRVEIKYLRPRLDNSPDARATVAGYLEGYNFSAEEVGLPPDEAALLEK